MPGADTAANLRQFAVVQMEAIAAGDGEFAGKSAVLRTVDYAELVEGFDSRGKGLRIRGFQNSAGFEDAGG